MAENAQKKILRMIRNKTMTFTEGVKMQSKGATPGPLTVWKAQANQFNTDDSDISADSQKGGGR